LDLELGDGWLVEENSFGCVSVESQLEIKISRIMRLLHMLKALQLGQKISHNKLIITSGLLKELSMIQLTKYLLPAQRPADLVGIALIGALPYLQLLI
jgi:hypothetical protein